MTKNIKTLILTVMLILGTILPVYADNKPNVSCTIVSNDNGTYTLSFVLEGNSNYQNIKIQSSLSSLTSLENKFTYSLVDNLTEVNVPDTIKTASYQDNNLTWTIPEVLDNYTYKLSVIIYPNQQAADIVAALNNKLITYQDSNGKINGLTVNFDEITKNDTGYTYKPVNAIAVSYNTNEQFTVSFDETIKVSSIPVTINTIWNDELDNSNRPSSYNITIKQDDNVYQTLTINQDSYVFYIAPGLKVNDQTLNNGHMYSIETPKFSDSYESTVSGTINSLTVDSSTLSLTHKLVTKNVKLQTIDDDSYIITGAKYTLKKKVNDNYVTIKDSFEVSNEGLELNNLVVGEYQLVQDLAANGYFKIQNPILFTVIKSGVVITSDVKDSSITLLNNNYQINIVNKIDKARLPSTGGTGNLPYILFGCMLVIVSILCKGCDIYVKKNS